MKSLSKNFLAPFDLGEIVHQKLVGGGCISETRRVFLDSGKSYFLKLNEQAPADFFTSEAKSLEALSVENSLRVPNVMVAERNFILLEDLGAGSPNSEYWDTLGEGKLYIGEWRNNKRHGTGSYFFNIPEWKENEHTEFWLKENFENYTGDFVEDHFQGKGTYRWPDGQRYEGSFFASDKHGEGVFYYTTGTSRKQFWHYGDLLR